jgi:hypothetical protein
MDDWALFAPQWLRIAMTAWILPMPRTATKSERSQVARGNPNAPASGHECKDGGSAAKMSMTFQSLARASLVMQALAFGSIAQK